MWAVGCMLYEFLVGCPPFESDKESTTLQKITNKSVCVPISVCRKASDLICKVQCF